MGNHPPVRRQIRMMHPLEPMARNQEPPRQTILAFPHEAALSREDFLVGGTNLAAWEAIEAWPRWPAPAMALIGPAGAGKTHLAAVWREKSGARSYDAAAIAGLALGDLGPESAILLEDIDRLAIDETALFHLFNAVREVDASLLMTARQSLSSLDIRLPDLMSRLRAIPAIEIAPPDDVLLRGLLVKLFADRQLAPDPSVIDYLCLRIERSFEAAKAVVAALDECALREKRRITRHLAVSMFGDREQK